MQEGTQYMFDDNICLTVFSAPNYCGSFGNKGGVILLNDRQHYKIFTFDAVDQPPAMEQRDPL